MQGIALIVHWSLSVTPMQKITPVLMGSPLPMQPRKLCSRSAQPLVLIAMAVGETVQSAVPSVSVLPAKVRDIEADIPAMDMSTMTAVFAMAQVLAPGVAIQALSSVLSAVVLE